ncbi:hypothetical protein EV182_004416, partial [Spiromyces aspiralis]
MSEFSGVVDELYSARNLFYVGAYEQAINALNALQVSNPEAAVERDVLLRRAQIAQGNADKVLSEVVAARVAADPFALAVRAWALCNAGRANEGLNILNTIVTSGSAPSSPVFAILAALVMTSNGQPGEAVKHLVPYAGKDTECAALIIQAFLLLNRGDLAKKALQDAKGFDNAVVLQLAEAWIKLKTGGIAEANSAYYIFDELAQTTSMHTARLFNGMAVSKFHGGNYAEAKKYLLEALERDPEDPDTLANLIVHAGVTGTAADDKVDYIRYGRIKRRLDIQRYPEGDGY